MISDGGSKQDVRYGAIVAGAKKPSLLSQPSADEARFSHSKQLNSILIRSIEKRSR